MRRRSAGAALAGGLLLGLALPALALAHPLGNFTINHYAGLRVGTDAIRLDVVQDMAEIPTFQERLTLDTDGDGDVSDAEADAARAARCTALAASLDLEADGRRLALELDAAGIAFPPGAGGLLTMRTVCEFRAVLPAPLAAGTRITFADHSYPERIGWREITVVGDGTTVDARGLPATSPSQRLTSYPQDMLSQPLDVTAASLTAAPGGPAAPPFVAPDAAPVGAAPAAATPLPAASAVSAVPAPAGSVPVAAAPEQGAVPGGVGGEISGLLGTRDLTPLVVLLSLATAALLGAGHALTPGHGKTIMAAYLVGTRGSARHALALGVSVTVSHTLGILALAAVIVAAGRVLPPELFQRGTAVVSAAIVLAIGAWLVGRQARAWLGRTGGHAGTGGGHAHDHGHTHEHDHDHSHGPSAPRTLTWRSLFALGLAGGIVPSTNALLILLATIATGRTEFGLVLVVAFGLGMTAVLVGVGLALVYARDWLDRRAASSGTVVARLTAWAPVATSVVVLGLGLWLTGQALVGPGTL